MAAQIAGIFNEGLRAKINDSKVLVVGAGGIGCEILKNLVLCGFPDIEIIDLDTIDVSNLNRQFLFHKEHVGKSKAEVARTSALSFNPNVQIKAYHDSIFSTDYGVSFYQKFGIVLNALDNRAARNHVNRMCLTADVPLIESGTAGYNGQVELIKKGRTQCYECTPKAAQKTFPGCTIRNTPSEPIHCIVWAKHLFNQLFGEYDPDHEVSPDTEDPESVANAGEAANASAANDKGNVERASTRTWATSIDYNPEKLFNKLFNDDIKYLLSMENLWKTRTPPTPVVWSEVVTATAAADGQPQAQQPNGGGTNSAQTVWSLQQCAQFFASSIAAIKVAFGRLPDGDHLVWDKDDTAGMDFVAACANIRSHVFGIAQKSRFEVKSMAGNIIPAIATTNAITAGLVVMRAFRVLQEEFAKCTSVYVRLVLNPRNQLLVPEKFLSPPNPDCIVCSDKPTIALKIDTGVVTIKAFRDDILIKALNMVDPDVTEEGKGIILISSEEGETDCNNDKLLSDLGIVDGCILKADDFFQNYELTITIHHRAVGRDDAQPFEVIADPRVLQPKVAAESSNGTTAAEAESSTPAKRAKLDADAKGDTADAADDDDAVIAVDDALPSSSTASGSAKQSAAGSSSSSSAIRSPPKKRKTGKVASEPKAKRSKPSVDDSDDDLIILDD